MKPRHFRYSVAFLPFHTYVRRKKSTPKKLEPFIFQNDALYVPTGRTHTQGDERGKNTELFSTQKTYFLSPFSICSALIAQFYLQ